MKRAVLCVANPQDYIPKLDDYSIMIINPNATPARNKYLLSNSDWSLYITNTEEKVRDGGDYPNERLLWYTSGTTGDSKFCSFSQAQLDNMAKTICDSYRLTANDRYVSVMSLWHAHGQGFYWATQRAGCETNYLSVKELRHLPKYSPTFITAIPDLLRVVGELNFDNNLRFIRGASAALPADVYRHLRYKFDIPVIEAFGMTEAMSHCFTNPLEGPSRIGTVGLPDGIDARIVDGHLEIRGFNVAYKGWYDTGDLADQDELGYYRILGRSKDQINIKGVKLNPLSLEKQLLETIPGLVECAVFGTDRVKCIYVGECDKNAIVNFLLTLGSHCRPILLESVDAIPVNSSGKVSRTYLNELYSS
jgi:acyl-coenzyme A synthetase/AMP-(fatty) acid ligase